MTEFHEGPPRYFRPVCVRWPWGFLGGPIGYLEVPESEPDKGPVVIEHEEDKVHTHWRERFRLFKRSLRFWWQRRIRGWDDSETWSLDQRIAAFALPRLIRLRELTTVYPADLGEEGWDAALADMIYAMAVCEHEMGGVLSNTDYDWERVERGLRLFGERFRYLWCD